MFSIVLPRDAKVPWKARQDLKSLGRGSNIAKGGESCVVQPGRIAKGFVELLFSLKTEHRLKHPS